jgi:hypothetical protein
MTTSTRNIVRCALILATRSPAACAGTTTIQGSPAPSRPRAGPERTGVYLRPDPLKGMPDPVFLTISVNGRVIRLAKGEYPSP